MHLQSTPDQTFHFDNLMTIFVAGHTYYAADRLNQHGLVNMVIAIVC